MIISKFNHQIGVLETKLQGDVTIEELIDYIVSTKQNTKYPRFLKILTDASEANMVFTHDELSLIVSETIESLEKYNFMQDAILVSSPIETALSILYQELSRSTKYEFQVFSTHQAAIIWLNKNQTTDNQVMKPQLI